MSQLLMEADGTTWLVRDDKWRYPLTGIHFGEWRMGFDTYGTEVDIYLRDISDATLDSLRVLRDELKGFTFHIEYN